jgi:hypothetical protein
MLIRRRLPRHVPNAIEPRQSERRPHPKVPVRRLGDGENGALGKAVPDLPRRMRVLTDVERRVQGRCTTAAPQKNEDTSHHQSQYIFRSALVAHAPTRAAMTLVSSPSACGQAPSFKVGQAVPPAKPVTQLLTLFPPILPTTSSPHKPTTPPPRHYPHCGAYLNVF